MFRLFLVGLLPLSVMAAGESVEVPPVPTGAHTVFAKDLDATKIGETWLSETKLGKSAFQMKPDSGLVFDLAPLKLEPGYYQIGLIARTGTRNSKPENHIEHYALSLETDDGKQALGGLKLPGDPKFEPVLSDGKPGSWGNWYAPVTCEKRVRLKAGAKLKVTNAPGHGQGGVLGLWYKKVDPQDAVNVRIGTSAANNAFIKGQTPKVVIELQAPEAMAAAKRFVRLDWYDLLTERYRVRFVPVKLKPGQAQTVSHRYPATPGVYRVCATYVDAKGDKPVDSRPLSECFYAYSPAKEAGQLPDDWPIGAHVSDSIPPLPGFRWYRYFSHWSKNNPGPGEFDWSRLDKVYKQVKQVGGKLMLATDGSPLWTTSKGKVGFGWMTGTANPPENWQALKTYLDKLVARYDDPSHTLASLEVYNEANTKARWVGTVEQLVKMTKIYEHAADQASYAIQVVAPSISAGGHDAFVQKLIDAGVLGHVDAVADHFYEELNSYERQTPINNMPRHVEMIAKPMHEAGYDLPILNTESGSEFVRRENGQLVRQQTLNKRARANPKFNPDEPWKIANQWRSVSERRSAATYVTGTVMLMALGVERTFVYSQYGLLTDGAPSLPWVALGVLGDHLDGVDYHQIKKLTAHVVDSDGADGSPKALAYLLGRPGQKRVIVTWAFISDTSVGRSKLWQPWLEPTQVTIKSDLPAGHVTDLYHRSEAQVTNEGGTLQLKVGEEPRFVTIPAK